MRDVAASTERMEELKQLGVRIAIDDFGNGYAYHSDLQRMPLDFLKVDRSSLAASDDEDYRSWLLEAILNFGRDLSLAVIAKGVETKEQMACAAAMGCTMAQGFLLGEPRTVTRSRGCSSHPRRSRPAPRRLCPARPRIPSATRRTSRPALRPRAPLPLGRAGRPRSAAGSRGGISSSTTSTRCSMGGCRVPPTQGGAASTSPATVRSNPSGGPMNRRLSPLPIAALACAAVLTGCGSGSSTTNSTATSASTTAQTSPSTAPSGTGTSSAQIQAAVSECKRIIQSQSKLPASAKVKLEGACAKAAEGDTTAVKKAAREVCEEVIDESPVPIGAAKQAALAACKK